MPGMSLPLHPQMLAGLRPQAPPMPGAAAAPRAPQANPFMGNANPGAFAQPAPFNPLLALTMLGQRGGMLPQGPGMGASGLMQRGPLGAFGLTPERQRPRSGGPPSGSANPYK